MYVVRKYQFSYHKIKITIAVKFGQKPPYTIRRRYNSKGFFSTIKLGQYGEDRQIVDTEIKNIKAVIDKEILPNFITNKDMSDEDKKYQWIHYLGQAYRLEVKQGQDTVVKVKGDSFIVFVKTLDQFCISSAIEEFYTMTLKKIVEAELPQLKSKFSIDFPVSFSYKNVTSYYGECFYKQQKIYLATRLAKYPLHLIEAILYHEFSHFIVPNHSAEFYEVLLRAMPDYRKRLRELKNLKYFEPY